MSWKDIKNAEKAEDKKVKKEATEPTPVDGSGERQPMFEDPMMMEEVYYQHTDEIADAFREKMSRENERVNDVVDSGYFFVVCFKSRAQLTECCDALRIDPTKLYHEGRDFMKALGRIQREADPTYPNTRPIDKDYSSRAMDKADINL